MTISVKECFIYPLKSGAGISVEGLELLPEGPKGDRRYMLVQAEGPNEGKFISQRDRGCEKMALIQTSENDETVEFKLPNGRFLKLPLDVSGKTRNARIWKDDVKAVDMGDKAATFFSDFLQTPCRLMKMSDDFNRNANPDFTGKNDIVSFADGFPLLVTNTASLNALQAHIDDQIDMNRFRANIVLDGLDAFEEDVIYTCKIGNDVLLEFVKPCTRCKLTTVEQQTGLQTSNEPIATLAKTRRGSADGLQGVFFGQNAVARKLGTIKVGDTVEIIKRRKMHPAVQQCAVKFKQ